MTRAAPELFDPRRVGDVYVERVGAATEAGRRVAKEIAPASADRERVCLFGIDCQIAFCTPTASLFVPGAVEDMQRTISFLYANVERVTEIVLSLDTHSLFQIFHPSWWEDERGEPPAPFTVIHAADVREGRFKARRSPKESLEYVEKLEAAGRYVLTIWPFHALLGGTSHAVVPSLMEAVAYHAAARDAAPRLVSKGAEPLTESYSVLAPEVTEIGGRSVGALDRALLDHLLSFDRVYVCGQAKSHCVLSTLRDLAAHIEGASPGAESRFYLLEDTMSPVPAPPVHPLPPELDYPAVAERAFAELAARGFRRARTTDAW